MEIKPTIIIGLGNPGKEYQNTYHNAGFLFTDYLNTHQISDIQCQILKSDVYMNESGKFVSKALKKSGAKPEGILIVHDDSDIELGKYKIAFARGSAGHNGVESIIKSLKTKKFWRLRIGIRPIRVVSSKKKVVRKKAIEFVLKTISKKDRGILEKVFEKAVKEIFTTKTTQYH